MIKVLFFAKLKQQLNCEQISIAAEKAGTISQLKTALISNQPQWAEYLQAANIVAAINQETAQSDSAIQPGDEVAFFPPVTGG